MYRWPTDDQETGVRFYQRAYVEGSVTDCPEPTQLQQLLDRNFRGTDTDFSDKIALLRRLRPGGRCLDFGCSWGYTIHQLKAAGYDACGFEPSAPRAEFGRKRLGVDILDDRSRLDALPAGSFDLIFSNHVFEHLSAPHGVIETLSRLLSMDGVLVVFVPNCGGRSATEQSVGWGPMTGEKHSLSLTPAFFRHALPRFGLSPRFASSPYEDALELRVDDDLPGDELMIVGRRAWA